ncbi:MAG: S4 domain-containing protein YaaA [Lactobacillaceae bacterium]|jgi:ribosome-associated protein|nr:S4 domain-containing protein YaaA [Lactobacillaceae bacterium]
MEKVEINTEFITLGQLLKIINITDSGGASKYYLASHPNDFNINNEKENRRGKKLYPNDIVKIKDFGEFKIVNVS